jgi:tetratricopeptide (TPR) repeat protein
MKTLLELNKEYTLELSGLKYSLLDVTGKGGSSIVYKAREEGKREYFVIKEFCPHDLDINRAEDGSITVPDNKKDEYEKRMSRALSESDIVNELRHDDEIKNNIPWFLSYGEPIGANNTLYTVIATESGEMLSSMIKRDFFIDKDFIDICDCIIKILDALKPIHDKKYLHLDISPDNILFSDLKVARLIDYNSAFRMDADSKDWIPSYKEGYSAPELMHRFPTKRPILSLATDLYSVMAIFFELLIGRTPKDGDWSNRKQWLLTSERGYLKEASNLLVEKTNDFLVKGLSKTPSLRYENVDAMREALEKLKELKQGLKLVNRPIRPYGIFVGRRLELMEIDKKLERDNYVFLEGIGGIGKTELAKQYAWGNKYKYDVIQFVNFNESLLLTIGSFLEIDGFDNAKYEYFPKEYIDKRIFEDKMSYLQKYDKRTLFVIDNYNVAADDNFHRFIANEYKIIFTSCVKHGGNVLEVESLKDKDELLNLFYKYYYSDEYSSPVKITAEDDIIIHDIIDLVLGHTMTVMLIASTMRANETTPKDMYERLQKGLDPELLTKIAVDKEEISAELRDQVMYQHILNLFNMDSFSKNDEENSNLKYIMTNMAIVPYTGLQKEVFYQWALAERYAGKNYNDINKLIKQRWLQYDVDTESLSLHLVISDVANKGLKPDSKKCKALIDNMIEVAEINISKTHIEWSICMHLMRLACIRICDNTENTVALLNSYAGLARLLATYTVAMEYSIKSAFICETVFGRENQNTANAYNNIASVYSNQGDYPKALEWFKISLDITKKVLGKKRPDTAITYNNIATVYCKQGDYPKALKWFKISLDITKKVLGKEHLDTAITYNNIATVYCKQGDYPKALEWHQKALAIREKVLGIEHLYTANSYNNIAEVYSDQGDYPKALEWHQKALAIHEKVLGNEHLDTSVSYNNIASVYWQLGDYPKALEWLKKALSIREKVLGIEHPDTANSYNNIAAVYLYQGDLPNSLEWDQKALAIYEKVLGTEHPDTANSYNNIALVYYDMGDYTKALDWLQKALAISEKVLGKEHPDTANSYDNIAFVYEKLGETDKAQEYREKAKGN